MYECVTDGVWGNIIGSHEVGWGQIPVMGCNSVMHCPVTASTTSLTKQDCPDNLPLPGPVMVHDIRDINAHVCRDCTDTRNSCGDIHKRTSLISRSPPALWSCLSFSADRDTWDADVHCESSRCVMSHVFLCPRSELQNMPPSGIVTHCVMKSEAGAWREA